MQICTIAFQLWLLTFGGDWRPALTLQLVQEQHDDRQSPSFGYSVTPVFPSGSESGATLEELATQAYKHERTASEAVEDAAKALLSSQSASARAAKQELLASAAAKQATEAVENIKQFKMQAERSLNASRGLAEELKLRTEAAIKQATGPVVDQAVQTMEHEASHMVEQLKASRQKLATDAALAAHNVEVEYSTAANQTREAAIAYQARAVSKAENVIALHKNAVQLATEALHQNATGNAPLAKQLQQRARGLIRQAEQEKLQAESIDAMARELNAEIPPLQQQAGQAMAFTKYQINPVGDRPLEIPPLPVPLRLISGGVPAPAPAPV